MRRFLMADIPLGNVTDGLLHRRPQVPIGIGSEVRMEQSYHTVSPAARTEVTEAGMGNGPGQIALTLILKGINPADINLVRCSSILVSLTRLLSDQGRRGDVPAAFDWA